MGFSLSKAVSKIDPVQHAFRHVFPDFTWGKLVTNNWRKLLGNYGVSSATGYQTVNGAYGVANDYHIDTRYRSLAELTGTK